MDKSEFSKLITNMLKVYGRDADASLLAIYYTLFNQYKINKLRDAIMKCMVECRFLPKPIEIIDRIDKSDGHTATYKMWPRYDAETRKHVAHQLTEAERQELGIIL